MLDLIAPTRRNQWLAAAFSVRAVPGLRLRTIDFGLAIVKFSHTKFTARDVVFRRKSLVRGLCYKYFSRDCWYSRLSVLPGGVFNHVQLHGQCCRPPEQQSEPRARSACYAPGSGVVLLWCFLLCVSSTDTRMLKYNVQVLTWLYGGMRIFLLPSGHASAEVVVAMRTFLLTRGYTSPGTAVCTTGTDLVVWCFAYAPADTWVRWYQAAGPSRS